MIYEGSRMDMVEEIPPFPPVLHVSDLHCGKVEDPHCENTLTLFNHIIGRYRERNQQPIIIITGDIVDDGSESQYKRFNRVIRTLLASRMNVLPDREGERVIELDRILYTPGNHDYGFQGLFPFKSNFNMFIQTDVNSYPMQWTIDRIHFVGLNSVQGVLRRGFLKKIINAGGEFGNQQLTDYERILRKRHTSPSERFVVFFHHHLFVESQFSLMRDRYDLTDRKRFLNITGKYNSKIDLVLFGHNHMREIYDEGKPVYISERESSEVEKNETLSFFEFDFNKEEYNDDVLQDFKIEIIRFPVSDFYRVNGIINKLYVYVRKNIIDIVVLVAKVLGGVIFFAFLSILCYFLRRMYLGFGKKTIRYDM